MSPSFTLVPALISDLKKVHCDVIVVADTKAMYYLVTFMWDVPTQNAIEHYKYELEVAFGEVSLASDPDVYLTSRIATTAQRMLVSMGENTTGKYPLTRLWSDLHLDTEKYLWRSKINVEGWVHNTYRGKGPKENSLDPLTGMEVSIEGDGYLPIHNEEPKDDLEQRLSQSVELAEIQNQAEGLKAVAQQKRRTVTRKRRTVTSAPSLVDPNKVKKPQCNGGGSGGPHRPRSMEFDPVKQKWICKQPGCKMTAKPVKDEDDRSVQVGRGSTSLRIVAAEEGVTVLLVSDDNLALNITPLVDVDSFILQNDLMGLAKVAVENDRDEFVDTTDRPLHLLMKVGVIGAKELLNKI
jgi:hypothetical protein